MIQHTTTLSENQAMLGYLEEWSQAVNAHGGFGRWRCVVAKAPGVIRDILIKNDATERQG